MRNGGSISKYYHFELANSPSVGTTWRIPIYRKPCDGCIKGVQGVVALNWEIGSKSDSCTQAVITLLTPGMNRVSIKARTS